MEKFIKTLKLILHPKHLLAGILLLFTARGFFSIIFDNAYNIDISKSTHIALIFVVLYAYGWLARMNDFDKLWKWIYKIESKEDK